MLATTSNETRHTPAETRGGSTYYYMQDGPPRRVNLGSVSNLVDADETTQNIYDTYAFGDNIAYAQTVNIASPYRYTGREFELGSYDSTHYYRNRYYIPYLGIFASRDAIWADVTRGWGYVGNSPVMWTDPLGRQEILSGQILGGGGLVGALDERTTAGQNIRPTPRWFDVGADVLGQLADGVVEGVEITPGMWGRMYTKKESCCSSEGKIWTYMKDTYFARFGISAKIKVKSNFLATAGACPPTAGVSVSVGLSGKVQGVGVGGEAEAGAGGATVSGSGSCAGASVGAKGGTSDGEFAGSLSGSYGKGISAVDATVKLKLVKIYNVKETERCCNPN